MLRARMDVERIAKLVEAQGGFRTFADEMPKDGDPIQNADTMMVVTGFGLGVQVFPQDYWTPLP